MGGEMGVHIIRTAVCECVCVCTNTTQIKSSILLGMCVVTGRHPHIHTYEHKLKTRHTQQDHTGHTQTHMCTNIYYNTHTMHTYTCTHTHTHTHTHKYIIRTQTQNKTLNMTTLDILKHVYKQALLWYTHILLIYAHTKHTLAHTLTHTFVITVTGCDQLCSSPLLCTNIYAPTTTWTRFIWGGEGGKQT